ncbi:MULTISPECIES: acyl-CoA dehydrogenase family protein [Halomonadaceae]|uniref:Acyl-CoA dehydrogenase family protein n=2 Tax=Vreelandella TaxID=3137766 RepID=A0A7Z0LQ43_9GAMM|nr:MULTISPECIES: acyl-CoA dehydrogenase family protein [Halomonas]NYS76453.1 acyl-CoA dehydrogenase family protein [Halomonas glaciei]
MRLEFTPKEEAFRQEVRQFVKDELDSAIKAKVERGLRLEKADYVAWYTKLFDKGWITPGWPEEEGGPGWTPIQKYLFDEETLLGGAPRIIASGINMLGPVLIAFGTPKQKDQYLPAIRRSESWWAQGFSEPGAGSDLASMRTTAVRDGDHYIVNGHKVWTSYAHFCDKLFCLVKTDKDAKPQEGISFLLMDLDTPGIEVRPIKLYEGGNDLNEVYLDNVRVPVENLIGEENKGWTYAKYLLGHERTGIAGIGASKQQLLRVKRLIKEQGMAGDSHFQRRVTELEIELIALEATGLRILGANQTFNAQGAEASMLKVRGTELRQDIFELLYEVAGPAVIPFSEEAMRLEGVDPLIGDDERSSLAANFLDSRKLSIYGGTNEVQRNVTSKMLLQG